MSSPADNAIDAPPVAGLVAEFASAEALASAAARLRDQGFTRWDVHSPFPVHGIDRAMGLRPTRLAWLVLGGGIVGGAVALLLQWWTSAVAYPHVISGKPFLSLPAFIPITFELIVLLSALAAFGGALAITRLPQFSHFAFRAERFRGATTDGFFISIAAGDPKFDQPATASLLESLGATAVEVCGGPDGAGRLPRALRWGLLIAFVVALVPPLLIALARQRHSERPRFHLVRDMDFQPKYEAQAASALFPDGRATRPAVPGTVAVGELSDDDHFYLGYRGEPGAAAEEQGAAGDQREYFDTFPPQVQGRLDELMYRGRERFGIYCAPCHGLLGDGQGMTSLRALERQEPDWVLPTSVHSGNVRAQPVGQLFHTITNGLGKMPAYAAQIPVEDRWAIVLYLRALQRSQNASIEDVPPDVRPQLR